MADTRPVLEFYSQLERGFGPSNELILVDFERPDEIHQRWNGGLADSDGSNLLGLNQADAAVQVLEKLGQTCGRHPTRGAAANDGNAADSTVGHGAFPVVGIVD
jgi:hypothetical protein